MSDGYGFKDILVHVDDGEAAKARCALAARLAAAHDAHLKGVFVAPVYTVAPYLAVEATPAIQRVHEEQVAAARETAEATFAEAAEAAGAHSEWAAAEGRADDVVATMARYADLAVIGQTDPRGEVPVGFEALAQHTFMASGRPVLAVPYTARGDVTLDGRAVVAWDGSREAARAVNDALPLLRAARETVVLVIESAELHPELGDLPGADIATHLARHGVTVTAERERSGDRRLGGQVIGFAKDDIEGGDLLLSQIADMRAELLVMGGYGRSRLREVLFGGMTRHVLEHMTVPTLFSH